MFLFRIAAVIAACLLLAVCFVQTAARPIPQGYVSKAEHFDPDGFQDCTDYCKYLYTSAEPFTGDARYHAITASEAADVAGYFENFRNWMEIEGRLDEYDFPQGCVNAGDYVLISTNEGQRIGDGRYDKYDDYTVCFFDTESLTLYCIHNNI